LSEKRGNGIYQDKKGDHNLTVEEEIQELDILVDLEEEYMKTLTDEQAIIRSENRITELIHQKQKLKFSTERKGIPKIYTKKEWKKFSIEIQEKLCQQYQLILINKDKNGNIIPEKHLADFFRQDKKKIAKYILKQFNKDNLNKSIGLVQQGAEQVSKMANSFSGMSRTEFKTGRNTSQSDNRSLNFLNGQTKRQKNTYSKVDFFGEKAKPVQRKRRRKIKKTTSKSTPLSNRNNVSFFSKKQRKFF
jgi:hypothetical protein